MAEKFRDLLLAQLLARTSYHLSKDFLATVARRGFTVRQWRLLGTLWDEDSLTLTELSEAILCKQSTTTRLVERLLELGLVGKNGDPNDRRRFHVFLTDKGRREIEDLIEGALAVEKETAAMLGPKRIAALRGELQRILDLLADRADDRG